MKIRLRKGQPCSVVSVTSPEEEGSVQGVASDLSKEGKKEDTVSSLTEISSPMVGTFYRSSSPETKPFVEEGDVVEEGQVICIIEAMKLMNEIKSEVNGKIVGILVETGHPVEYGQSLFAIELQ